MLLNRDTSLLLVIDIQERLLPAIHDGGRVLTNTLKLIHAADHLSVPIRCSEQYPKGLGRSVRELIDVLSAEDVFEKVHFSCASDPVIADSIAQSGRKQLVVCGAEAHVCVLQSALGFIDAGYDVFVVLDAVSSRRQESVDVAQNRIAAAGGTLVTVEMVLFEWLRQAGTQDFRDLRGLIA